MECARTLFIQYINKFDEIDNELTFLMIKHKKLINNLF